MHSINTSTEYFRKRAKILRVIKPEGKPIYSWCQHGDLPLCVKLEHNDVTIQTTDQNAFSVVIAFFLSNI